MAKTSVIGTKKTAVKSTAKKAVTKTAPKKISLKSSTPKVSAKSLESLIRSDAQKGTKKISSLLTPKKSDPHLEALLEIAKKLDTIIDLLLSK